MLARSASTLSLFLACVAIACRAADPPAERGSRAPQATPPAAEGAASPPVAEPTQATAAESPSVVTPAAELAPAEDGTAAALESGRQALAQAAELTRANALAGARAILAEAVDAMIAVDSPEAVELVDDLGYAAHDARDVGTALLAFEHVLARKAPLLDPDDVDLQRIRQRVRCSRGSTARSSG